MKNAVLCALLLLLANAGPAAIDVSPLPYGINAHLVSDAALAKAHAAGIAWIRIDIDWGAVEPQPGRFEYGEVDRVVGFAAAHGLSVFATIGRTPGWANGMKGETYPADRAADWQAFVARTVGRFRDRVKYWGIWNEPNLKLFFALDKAAFLERVLLPGIEAVRGADPSAFLVGPELSHKTENGSEWYFWMKYLLDNAGAELDIISHHLYEDNGVYFMYELLEQGDQLIPAVRQIIEESGQGGKPFWITETGWHTRQYSEQMQASRYLDLLHARARRNYPHKIFFYELIDDPRQGIDPFGILRSDQSEKMAYAAYRDYIAGLIPDPGDPDDGKNEKKCYAEQITGHGSPAARNPDLRPLFAARGFLRRHSTSGAAAVAAYYRWEGEFRRLALADARVDRLGRSILARLQALAGAGMAAAIDRPLPDGLALEIASLAALVSHEHPDSPLAPLARLGQRHLEQWRRAPLRRWLEIDWPQADRNLRRAGP